MADYILGKDCIAYRNTGNYSSPTWAAITAVKDVTLNSEVAKWDGSRRATRYRQYAPTLGDIGVDFNLVYKQADSGPCEAIRDAHFNGTSIDMAFATAAIASAGTEYLRAEWGVFKFTRNEPLEEGVIVDVSLAPFISSNAPSYTEVA